MWQMLNKCNGVWGGLSIGLNIGGRKWLIVKLFSNPSATLLQFYLIPSLPGPINSTWTLFPLHLTILFHFKRMECELFVGGVQITAINIRTYERLQKHTSVDYLFRLRLLLAARTLAKIMMLSSELLLITRKQQQQHQQWKYRENE